MSKKESNPPPPRNAVKPPAPPAPPSKRIIKEDVDLVAFAKSICRPLLWGFTDDELNKWRR